MNKMRRPKIDIATFEFKAVSIKSSLLIAPLQSISRSWIDRQSHKRKKQLLKDLSDMVLIQRFLPQTPPFLKPCNSHAQQIPSLGAHQVHPQHH